MFSSLKPRTVAAVCFYPALVICLLVCLLPVAAAIHSAVEGGIPLAASIFFTIAAVGLGGSMAVALVPRIRQWALRIGANYKINQVKALYTTDVAVQDKYAQYLKSKMDRGDWSVLAMLGFVLTLAGVLTPVPVHAQYPGDAKTERAAPTNPAFYLPTEDDCLKTVRLLQTELRLNEYGVIRALKYLRQGYSETDVRNLFAAVVVK